MYYYVGRGLFKKVIYLLPLNCWHWNSVFARQHQR